MNRPRILMSPLRARQLRREAIAQLHDACERLLSEWVPACKLRVAKMEEICRALGCPQTKPSNGAAGGPPPDPDT